MYQRIDVHVSQPVLVCQCLLLDCPVVLSQRNTFICNFIYLKMSWEQKVNLWHQGRYFMFLLLQFQDKPWLDLVSACIFSFPVCSSATFLDSSAWQTYLHGWESIKSRLRISLKMLRKAEAMLDWPALSVLRSVAGKQKCCPGVLSWRRCCAGVALGSWRRGERDCKQTLYVLKPWPVSPNPTPCFLVAQQCVTLFVGDFCCWFSKLNFLFFCLWFQALQDSLSCLYSGPCFHLTFYFPLCLDWALAVFEGCFACFT